MGHERASRFALKLGETFAALIFLLGVYYENWLLPFVALFIYIGASQERQEVDLMVNLFQGTAADALVGNPQTLSTETTLADALEQFRHSAQQDFPVLQGDAVVGSVSKARLLAAMKEQSLASPVRDIMDPQAIIVELDASLEQVYQEMREKDKDIVVVLAEGKLAGLIDQKQLDKYEQLGPVMA